MNLLLATLSITALCFTHAAPSSRMLRSCASADCARTSNFCNSALQCEPIPFSRYPITEGAAVAGSSSFDIVMATDVQFYFTTCKDEPRSECIFTGVTGAANRESALLTATDKQVECITALVNDPARDVKAIFNNGDITNSGTQSQLDDIETYFHQPVSMLNVPMIVALGNHDYANTIPDKPERKRMINFLASSLDTLTASGFKIRSIDWQLSPTIFNHYRLQDEVHNQGSFSFSFEINNYVFIVLHWSTGLPTGRYLDYFHAPDSTYEEYFDVTSVESYLRGELISATNDGKSIILVPHSWRGLEKFINNRGLDSAISSASVVAILAGHDHDQWGLFTNAVYGTTSIPVYYAGSTSYQRLIAAKFDAGGGGITVDVYDTSTGSSCSTTGADTATRFVIPEFGRGAKESDMVQ